MLLLGSIAHRTPYQRSDLDILHITETSNILNIRSVSTRLNLIFGDFYGIPVNQSPAILGLDLIRDPVQLPSLETETRYLDRDSIAIIPDPTLNNFVKHMLAKQLTREPYSIRRPYKPLHGPNESAVFPFKLAT
jgi:hypothetical protein